MKKFKLGYWLQNNGDGSASVMTCSSKEEGSKLEEKAIEEGMDGWGEDCSGEIILRLNGESVERFDSEWNEEKGKFEDRWIPLQVTR